MQVNVKVAGIFPNNGKLFTKNWCDTETGTLASVVTLNGVDVVISIITKVNMLLRSTDGKLVMLIVVPKLIISTFCGWSGSMS